MNLYYLSARPLVRNDEGQDLLEYALLVALIAIVCVVAVGTTGTNVNAHLRRRSRTTWPTLDAAP